VEKIAQATATELYDTAEIGEATARKMIKWCTSQINPGAEGSTDASSAQKEDSTHMQQRRLDIEDIPGVGPAIAEKLRDAGFLTVESIATSLPATLAEAAELGEATAKKMIKWCRDQADIGGFKTGTDVFEQRLRSRSCGPLFRRLMTLWEGDLKPRLSPRCTESSVLVNPRLSTRWQSTSSSRRNLAVLMVRSSTWIRKIPSDLNVLSRW